MLVASHSTLSELCNDTAYASIDVEGYNITNVFTPNGDGVNDQLNVIHENIYHNHITRFKGNKDCQKNGDCYKISNT